MIVALCVKLHCGDLTRVRETEGIIQRMYSKQRRPRAQLGCNWPGRVRLLRKHECSDTVSPVDKELICE